MYVNIEYHIRRIRHSRRISLRQLERMSGVSRSEISYIETGQKDARLTTMCLLASALDLKLENLFSYEIKE